METFRLDKARSTKKDLENKKRSQRGIAPESMFGINGLHISGSSTFEP